MVFFIKPSVCDLETIFEIVEAGNEYPVAEATFPVAEAVPELVEGWPLSILMFVRKGKTGNQDCNIFQPAK